MQSDNIFESKFSIAYLYECFNSISLRVHIFLDHSRVSLTSDVYEWHTTSSELFFLYGDDSIRSNFRVAQNGMLIMGPLYLGSGTMMLTWRKFLDFRFSESSKNECSRTFLSTYPWKVEFSIIFALDFSSISSRHTFRVLKITNCIDSQSRSWHFFCLCQSNMCFSWQDLLLMMKMEAEINAGT